jgi:hypothetical protein
MSIDGVTTLQTLLDWVVRVGAMYLAFEITERLAWPGNSELRRYVAFAIAAVVGLAAWGVGIEFGYIAAPEPDWHCWIESATGVVLTIVLGAQVAHARVVLSEQNDGRE